MYSNVVYASLWKAMNGFSESMVDEVPIRNTPPSLTVLPLLPPLPEPPQAATTSTVAVAASWARAHAPKCVFMPMVPSTLRLLERTFKVRNPDMALARAARLRAQTLMISNPRSGLVLEPAGGGQARPHPGHGGEAGGRGARRRRLRRGGRHDRALRRRLRPPDRRARQGELRRLNPGTDAGQRFHSPERFSAYPTWADASPRATADEGPARYLPSPSSTRLTMAYLGSVRSGPG